MLRLNDIQEVWIGPEEIDSLRENVQKASVGGRSNIHEGQDRLDNLTRNQWSGQVGEYTCARYVLEKESLYWKTREIVNQNPKLPRKGGDYYKVDSKGNILETLPFDAKCTQMKLGRRGREDILGYNLIVPPDEYQPDLIYVQLLMPYFDPNGFPVYICGCLTAESLPPPKPFLNEGLKYYRPIFELLPIRDFQQDFVQLASYGT